MKILDRYEVVKCLGAGAMGLVYLCRHLELGGHLVAVKVLSQELIRRPEFIERIRDATFTSYGISHPNVIRAYEYSRNETVVAITMEYADGGDLATRLSEVIPIKEILRVLSQICAGTQAIHKAGIIHRNLKPENILFKQDGTVKIGISWDQSINSLGTVDERSGLSGSIDYVAPEYLLNGTIDRRADIYGIGCLAYEMLTGESPFSGASVLEAMTKRLKSSPESPMVYRSDCPEELGKIVLKAMSLEPDARFQTAAEMFNALQSLRGSDAEAIK